MPDSAVNINLQASEKTAIMANRRRHYTTLYRDANDQLRRSKKLIQSGTPIPYFLSRCVTIPVAVRVRKSLVRTNIMNGRESREV
jgi:hypothetical protein